VEKTNSLTAKKIAAFTAYSAFERVLIVLSGMISLVIIGKLGKFELAGGSIANTIINILQVPFLSLGTAAMVMISSDERKKRKISYDVTFVSIILSVILFFVVAFFSRPIVNLLFGGTEEKIKDITVCYMSVFKWAIPFMAIDLVLSGCMRGWKNAKTPLTFTVVGNIINIALCIIFVNYMNKGYIGGAYAQLISSAIICIIKIICVGKALSLENTKEKVSLLGMGSVVSKSMPFSVNLFFVRVGFLGMQVVTALLGTEMLTGYQVANNILSVLYAVTGGGEIATMTYVSACWAGNKREYAKKVSYAIAWVSVIILSAMGVLIALKTSFFAEIFNSDISSSESALRVIRIMCITIPFTSFFQCIQGVMNVGNHAKTVTLSTILCSWCMRLPLSYVLVKFCDMGFTGLFIGFMADYLTRTVLYGAISRKLLNRRSL